MPEHLELEFEAPPTLELRMRRAPEELPADMGVLIPSAPGGAAVSADTGNRAETGTDGGVYVRDDLVPDPLAYYILAKA